MKALLLLFLMTILLHPVTAQVSGRPVFAEYFENNNRAWRTEYGKDRTMLVANGCYTQEGYRAKTNCYTSQLVSIDPTKDFRISVTVRHLSGDLNSAYGFTFGHDSDDAGYIFTITADGQFAVTTKEKPIRDWAGTNTIYPRHNQNILGVSKKGNECTVYINGKKAGSFSAPNLNAESYFFLGLLTLGRQKVAFDDVEVYQ